MRFVVRLVVATAAGLVLAAGPARSGSPARRIEIVVDASIEMYGALGDDHTRMDAVRRALVHTVLQLPADGRDGSVSLHLLGSERVWWSDNACDDVTTVTTEAPVDHDRLVTAIDDLEPTGARPLDSALESILARASTDPSPLRVVLILAEDNNCPGDRTALLEAIEARGDQLDMRVVGVAMPPDVARQLGEVVPTRNAWNVTDLVTALEQTVRGTDADRPRRSEIEIRSPVPIPPDLRAEVVGPAGDEPDLLKLDGGRITGRLFPGRYTLRIVTSDDQTVTQRGPVDVIAGTDLFVELAPLPPSEPSIETEPERPMVGATVWVHRWGEPAPGSSWAAAVAPAESPPETWVVHSSASDDETEVALTVPETGRGPHQLRVLEGPPGGPYAVVASQPWEPLRPAVLLEVPDRVETGTPLDVAWNGPALPGDRIEIERTDPPGEASTVCLRVLSDDGGAMVRAPSEPGTYRARYVLGPIRATATSRSVELYEILARIDAPDTVAVGSPVEIRWEGPAEPHDFLAIATAGSPDDAYGPWSPVTGGSPTIVNAPPEAGPWEIRYVAGDTGDVFARAPLVVEEIAITLQVPSTVSAGTRFEITWTGTSAPGDVIAVAPVGSPPTRLLDWTDADAGSPVSLAAPFVSGAFEVRYVRPETREILATSPIEVVK